MRRSGRYRTCAITQGFVGGTARSRAAELVGTEEERTDIRQNMAPIAADGECQEPERADGDGEAGKDVRAEEVLRRASEICSDQQREIEKSESGNDGLQLSHVTSGDTRGGPASPRRTSRETSRTLSRRPKAPLRRRRGPL